MKDGSIRPAPGFEVQVGAGYAYGWGRFQKDIGLDQGRHPTEFAHLATDV